MTKEGPHCGAKYFKEEHNARGKYTKCCMEGKIALPPIQPPPPDVLGLFEGITDDSQHFLANLRQYNSMMAFASWQAQLRTHAGRGVPVITIHGKAYHMTGVPETNENRTAQYAELYIMDTRQAMRQRVDNNENLKENIIQLLQNQLMAVNPFAHHYQASSSKQRTNTDFQDGSHRQAKSRSELHDTFKRAALAMGLLEDDAEHRRCMAEAALFNMPSQLRELFATLLMFQPPSDLRALFNEFVDVMSEDFVRQNS
eukprot:gene20938-biopygen15445